MNTPIWLLDVDGVLNAFDESRPVLGDWDDWTGFTANAFPIRYSPTMTKRILALHESGAVEVQWLTTWGRLANEHLSEQFGFPEFKVAAEMPFRERNGWWKLEVVQSLFDQGHSIIWTDDDIPVSTSTLLWISSVADMRRDDDLLALAPRGAISQEDMKDIEKWLEARNAKP